MNNCSMPQATFEFTKDEINQAVKDNRLLSVELEFSLRCNLRCQYCYIPDKNNFENDLTQGELREVILQVKELGARGLPRWDQDVVTRYEKIDKIRFKGD